jgi:putative transcriptional regulator
MALPLAARGHRREHPPRGGGPAEATLSLTGKFLVAMPGLEDTRFAHAVVLMCQHSSESAMGVIVNKPKEALLLGSVLSDLAIPAREGVTQRVVMDGGPVASEHGFVLHSSDYASAGGTRQIMAGVRFTSTRDVLEAMAQDEAPEQFMLALGCATWGGGQLESELKRNAWLVVDGDEDLVFDQAHDMKWARAIAQLGIDPAQLIGHGGTTGGTYQA